ncbi:hypothetical protein ASPZODRAFT_133822 [Penicilliopsis zonata CBS 506.65]|uniref:Transcription factor domain-containing protein n=1 Tax=Penicilliopsis zonata CBS 506.65 TaxID=1073090 RepID=A0A1L9SD84_9EURO|nr:hypothetical protein ASPZODRAFT_133822 [Penicilliopsis zonata CBS 506.65]OJJ45185.1 hypothetical protein ASPZODRAFT_133822 [Penicilliopsis zonata CBS 506.65]
MSDAQLDAQTPASEAASSSNNTVDEREESVDPSALPGGSMAMDSTLPYETMPSFPFIPPSVPTIPPGAISADDAETLSLYFNRHPFEQVISLEFVDEMNASTWMVFQDSPQAVAEALCSIGSVYLEDNSRDGALLPLTLARRARTLATLKVKDPSRELEQMLLMALALGAMEGIDRRCQPHERTSSILIAYAASIINRYIESGLVLSSLAKYFIRALARHDMIISLSHLRRNSIRTDIWLDENNHSPDRFMGSTTTLMPLLEELCGLAEDIQRHATPIGPAETSLFTRRADGLRSRIQAWQCVSAAWSARLLAHAHAYRAAALLMLFRLLHGAGSSVESDQTALEMAREVMRYLKRPPEDLRLCTWPALIASCELREEEDRTEAMNVFHSIYSVRRTSTSLQTLKFVTDRVWRARDEGAVWNWMALSQQFPGECVPI